MSVIPLSLPDFGFLISLGHDVGESSSSDGSHELLRSSRPLFRRFFHHSFAMLPTVKHRPIDLEEGEKE